MIAFKGTIGIMRMSGNASGNGAFTELKAISKAGTKNIIADEIRTISPLIP
jgi:hypothetical protein